MEIRVLRYFLTVAREGNITNAANFLHVTQPTISRQLKDLEDELGAQLFNRHKQTISLTHEGMLLRKRAEEILSIVDKTEEDFNAMGDILGGDVFIGGGESEGFGLVAEVIAELQKEYPLVHYHLFSGNAEDVTERLDKGILDFGILLDPVNLAKYHHLPLPVTDKWGVLMRKDSPLAEKEFITKEDLLEVPLIASRQTLDQPFSSSTYVEWFGEDFDKLNVFATFNLVYNAALLVEKGAGYMITFENLTDTSESNNICFRPLKPAVTSGMHIAWKKYQVFSPAAEVFYKKLVSKFENKQPK